MIHKNVLLMGVVIISSFSVSLKATEIVDQNQNDTTEEPKNITAAQMVAAAIIEAAKIKAAADVKASESYGLAAAKQWAPVLGMVVSIYALTQLASVVKKVISQ